MPDSDGSWDHVEEAPSVDTKPMVQAPDVSGKGYQRGGVQAKGQDALSEDAPAPWRPSALRREARLGKSGVEQQKPNDRHVSFIPSPTMDESGQWSRKVPEGTFVYTYGKSTCLHIDCHTLRHRERQIANGQQDAKILHKIRCCACVVKITEDCKLVVDANTTLHRSCQCERFIHADYPMRLPSHRVCCHCMRDRPAFSH